MKKIINSPKDVVMETLEGFVCANAHDVEFVPMVKGVKVRNVKEKPALIIGGGSGHEPMFAMFIGENMADAAACGNIFASPDPGTIMQTAMSVETGKGVLFVYGNYSGDNLNFDMSAEMLNDMGIKTRTVRVWDDVASAPKERISDRRGIAGDLFVIKIGGAATAETEDLEEAYRITAKARDNTFSIGVALSGATLPGEPKPLFALPDDEMEFGMGIHGEPGVRRTKMQTADEIVETLAEILIQESGMMAGNEVCTLVNGLGSTTLSELHIMNRKLQQILKEKGVHVHDMEVNSYVTSQEMAGASLTIFKLDNELKKYYDMPCWTPYYKKRGNKHDGGTEQ